jgi:hypothetical protein
MNKDLAELDQIDVALDSATTLEEYERIDRLVFKISRASRTAWLAARAKTLR